MPLCALSKIPLPLSSPGSQHCGASNISQVTLHGHRMSPGHCSQSSAQPKPGSWGALFAGARLVSVEARACGTF